MTALTESAEKYFFERFTDEHKDIHDHLTSHGYRYFSRGGEHVYIKGHENYRLVKHPYGHRDKPPVWVSGYNHIGDHSSMRRRIGI